MRALHDHKREYVSPAGVAVPCMAVLVVAAVLEALGVTARATHADDAISTDTPEATVTSLHRGLIAASQSSPGASVETVTASSSR